MSAQQLLLFPAPGAKNQQFSLCLVCSGAEKIPYVCLTDKKEENPYGQASLPNIDLDCPSFSSSGKHSLGPEPGRGARSGHPHAPAGR
jgi:hypothetical protein